MEGSPTRSAEVRRIRKGRLSKTVAGKTATKQAILNRMSSGKKHPRSEPRVRKGTETPAKGDLLAKRLVFQEKDNVNEEEVEERGGQGVSPAKSKKKPKTQHLQPQSPFVKGVVKKSKLGSASKWQVSEGKPRQEELGGEESVKKGIKKAKAAWKKSKTMQGKGKDRDDDDDGDDSPGEEEKHDDKVDFDSADDEIDFPVLKRKSLGLDGKASDSTDKLMVQGRQILPGSSQNGQKEKAKQGKAVKKQASSRVEGDEGKKSQEGKKKRSKKRGKKRKRSTSESEEPQVKKGRQVEDFTVRCGNLPLGTGKSDLRMFFGEADIFPKTINIKNKKKTVPGEKKHFIRYATIVCNSADEAERLCRLNGISMPSTLGGRECKLLIHNISAEDADDTMIAFKRKLCVRNLHPRITEEELLEYFKEHKFNPTNAIISRKGDSKNSRGYAFVWLKSSGDVDRAIGLEHPTLRDQVFSMTRSNRPPHKTQEP